MSKRAKKGTMGKVKAVECWAPVRKDTGEVFLQEKHIQKKCPPDDTGGWCGTPLTYIRVRIVPLEKKKARKTHAH